MQSASVRKSRTEKERRERKNFCTRMEEGTIWCLNDIKFLTTKAILRIYFNGKERNEKMKKMEREKGEKEKRNGMEKEEK